jgi:hypothetical protein
MRSIANYKTILLAIGPLSVSLDIASVLKEVAAILKDTRVIEDLKYRLLKAPKQVLVDLDKILNEIIKSFKTISYFLDTFADLSFTDKKIKESKEFLKTLKYRNLVIEIKNDEGQTLIENIADARGHCKTIKQLYQNKLQKWAKDNLNSEENDKIKELFEQKLDPFDTKLTGAIDKLEVKLNEAAILILSILTNDTPNLKEAKDLKENIVKSYDDIRIRMGSDLKQLLNFQIEIRNVLQ